MRPLPHLQEILHAQDVAAQDGRFEFPHTDGFATPGFGGAGDDVVATDTGEFLGEHLGLAIGQVGVFGHNGRLGHHDAGAGVFKICVDTDFITCRGKKTRF